MNIYIYTDRQTHKDESAVAAASVELYCLYLRYTQFEREGIDRLEVPSLYGYTYIYTSGIYILKLVNSIYIYLVYAVKYVIGMLKWQSAKVLDVSQQQKALV